MKKIAIFLISIFFGISFSIPLAKAYTQFEASIIRCGEPGGSDGCGYNPISEEPLNYGKLKVDSYGTVRVLLVGAAPQRTYRIFVGTWSTLSNGGEWQHHYKGDGLDGSIGAVTTDDRGNYDGRIIKDRDGYFSFPPKTKISQPNFAFNGLVPGVTVFTTGLMINNSPPPSTGAFPEIINENNVTISIKAGEYYQGLTVYGNGFTLQGEKGLSCIDQSGWSIIKERVIIYGNNAKFKNIKFLSPVIEKGNNTTFIDCCMDDDGDGPVNAEEKGFYRDDNDYDGNGDGMPDRVQGNVSSFHTIDYLNYVTMTSPTGTLISNCAAEENPSESDSPKNVNFTYGFFKFSVDDVGIGDNTAVTFHLPNGQTLNTYYKYGPTPDKPANHWYEFLYDGQTGAVIDGNVITLYFVDGLRGDDDITANGTITDIGGPGTTIDGSQVVSNSGGGGGGCFINTSRISSLFSKK
jgi:hypothetical protein